MQRAKNVLFTDATAVHHAVAASTGVRLWWLGGLEVRTRGFLDSLLSVPGSQAKAHTRQGRRGPDSPGFSMHLRANACNSGATRMQLRRIRELEVRTRGGLEACQVRLAILWQACPNRGLRGPGQRTEHAFDASAVQGKTHANGKEATAVQHAIGASAVPCVATGRTPWRQGGRSIEGFSSHGSAFAFFFPLGPFSVKPR